MSCHVHGSENFERYYFSKFSKLLCSRKNHLLYVAVPLEMVPIYLAYYAMMAHSKKTCT